MFDLRSNFSPRVLACYHAATFPNAAAQPLQCNTIAEFWRLKFMRTLDEITRNRREELMKSSKRSGMGFDERSKKGYLQITGHNSLSLLDLLR